MISTVVIKKIKSRIDIVEFISSTQEVKPQGKNYHSSCPECSSKSSFVIYPESQSFYCFNCAFSGDITTFVMKSKKLDFTTAVSKLAAVAGVDMSEPGGLIISDLMRDAARYYHTQLRKNPKAQKAIDTLQSWGIQGKNVVQLGIGFKDDSFGSFMRYMTN